MMTTTQKLMTEKYQMDFARPAFFCHQMFISARIGLRQRTAVAFGISIRGRIIDDE